MYLNILHGYQLEKTLMNLRNVKGNGRDVIASRSVIPTFAGKK